MSQQNYEKMVLLNLNGMAQAYREQQGFEDIHTWTFNQRLSYMLDMEIDKRNHKTIERRLKQADLCDQQARIEFIDYAPDRKLNRETIELLSTNQYIHQPKNVIIQGATGSGKSYLASALGHNACLHNIKTRYIRLPDLLTEYELARAQGTMKKIQKHFEKIELLIIDEWLLYPLNHEATRDILELMERRYRKYATILCSQIAKDGWHERFGGSIVADSIMDRILAKSIQITIHGDTSMRLRT